MKLMALVSVLFGALGYYVLGIGAQPPPSGLLASIVKIEAATGWGSGVAIDHYKVADTSPHTLIITAAHVVDDDVAVKLHIGASVVTGRVLKRDKDADLALIETSAWLPVIPLATDLQVGEPAWVIGFPMASGEIITTGFLSTVEKGGIEASASVYPGNSGGALIVYHKGYQLAGVVDSLAIIPTSPFSVTLAATVEYSVPLDKIRSFIGG